MPVYRIRGTVHHLSELIFRVPGRVYAPPFPDAELVRALHRIVQQERPQIVRAHNWLLHSFLPLAPRSDAKIIETLHSVGLTCVKWNMLYHDEKVCDGPGFFKCLECLAEGEVYWQVVLWNPAGA